MKEIELLRTKMPEICGLGFIQSTKKGDAGVGHTLETLLGIEENNSSGADLGTIELKAKRNTSRTRVTGFTQDQIWVLLKDIIIKKYGRPLESNDKYSHALNCTINTITNSNGLRIVIENETLYVKDVSDNILSKVHLEVLCHRFSMKLNRLCLVHADRKLIDKVEHFHYNSVFICQNPDIKNVEKLLLENKLVVEYRMSLCLDGSIRNHGTAYRIHEKYLKDFYNDVEELCLK